MKLLAVIGTRPEAIKMAPVVREARRRGCAIEVCAAAQHRELLDQALRPFGIEPEYDLDLMRPGQSLADLTARAIEGIDGLLGRVAPQWVLVQGDTTTTLAASLAAFYQGRKVAHIEAGLRTRDLSQPFPEEHNRIVVDRVAAAHFVPTSTARESLLCEGLPAETLHLTGNTVIDALRWIRKHPSRSLSAKPAALQGERRVVATIHRRESFGPVLGSIGRALRRIVDRHEDVRLILPLHPNPNVRPVLEALLVGHPRISLVEPMDYPEFVEVMAGASLILSDSGGVQEEAPSLGVPALFLRATTERPEAIEAGAVRLVPPDEDGIVSAAEAVLSDPGEHARMARAVNPYGDGRAAERIVSILRGEPWTPFGETGQ